MTALLLFFSKLSDCHLDRMSRGKVPEAVATPFDRSLADEGIVIVSSATNHAQVGTTSGLRTIQDTRTNAACQLLFTGKIINVSLLVGRRGRRWVTRLRPRGLPEQPAGRCAAARRSARSVRAVTPRPDHLAHRSHRAAASAVRRRPRRWQ